MQAQLGLCINATLEVGICLYVFIRSFIHSFISVFVCLCLCPLDRHIRATKTHQKEREVYENNDKHFTIIKVVPGIMYCCFVIKTHHRSFFSVLIERTGQPFHVFLSNLENTINNSFQLQLCANGTKKKCCHSSF